MFRNDNPVPRGVGGNWPGPSGEGSMNRMMGMEGLDWSKMGPLAWLLSLGGEGRAAGGMPGASRGAISQTPAHLLDGNVNVPQQPMPQQVNPVPQPAAQQPNQNILGFFRR